MQAKYRVYIFIITKEKKASKKTRQQHLESYRKIHFNHNPYVMIL